MTDNTCIDGRTINRQPRAALALTRLLDPCSELSSFDLLGAPSAYSYRALVRLSCSSERACMAALSLCGRPATKKQTLTNARGSAGYDGNG
jgi:hypothetical protein